ncbi:structural cement protein Gp24 [Leptospira interrogans]|uniref:structural cement protein Gp24 n=1 Tax=Leptospira interrogans TaxID=173 RepID=UPI001F0CE28E|nr:hypothetical protein [Leptospira interrogans]UMQ59618.1 hypothetical protein FH585_07780 [Leptospira interrogans]UNE68539.1 hypothetical protein FH588_10125 [Leptospira interrogans]
MTAVPFHGYDESDKPISINTSGSPGKRAKTGPFEEKTKVAEGDIPFGSPVSLSADNERIEVSKNATAKFQGIAVESIHAKGYDNGKYINTDVMIVAIAGLYWVPVEEAVDESKDVRIRIVDHATDPIKKKGMFCTTPETGETVLVRGITYEDKAAASGTVPIRLAGYFELVAD